MKKANKERQELAFSWYKRYLKRLTIQSIMAWVVFSMAILFAVLLLLGMAASIMSYKEAKEQVTVLTKERRIQRAEIQQSITAAQTKKFEQSQAELTKDWSGSSNYYTVTIGGQKLEIDRNNIFVSDNAKVLDNETKQKIYQMNQEFAQFNDGQQLMIMTIKALPSGMSIESFSEAVFNQLGIGQAEQNNGLLYVMAIKDHKTRIEVGYGLETTVTDAQAGIILDDEETVADFKEEAYDKGVNRILDQLYTMIGSLTPEYDLQIKEAKEREQTNKIASWVCLTTALLCLLMSGLFLKQTQKIKKQSKQLCEKEIYYLYLAAPILILTSHRLKALVATGKVMSMHVGAKRKGTAILVGNRLYDSSGLIITRDYASYQSSSSRGGSSSGGSFGGGSSGGGGASGGW